jgi:TonB family protein
MSGLILIILTLFLLQSDAQTNSQANSQPRVAIVDLQGDEDRRVVSILEDVARHFVAVDRDLSRRAARGASYSGSLNLTSEEARSLGESIGCDYYVTGIVRNFRRLGSEGEAYFEAIGGIYLIETWSGRLVRFEFVRERAENETAAANSLVRTVGERASGLKDAITHAHRQRRSQALELPRESPLDVVNLDGQQSSRDLTPPVFYERLRPDYTAEAASIDLIATVEVYVVFGAGGRVETSEIVRWAGFGLDESALVTIRRLRFKSATKNGNAVSVRGLVRYNFRRPPPQADRDAEANKLRESIRKTIRTP